MNKFIFQFRRKLNAGWENNPMHFNINFFSRNKLKLLNELTSYLKKKCCNFISWSSALIKLIENCDVSFIFISSLANVSFDVQTQCYVIILIRFLLNPLTRNRLDSERNVASYGQHITTM